MAKKQSVHSYSLNYVASQFNNILSEIVTEYSEELSEKADKITQTVAEDFARQLAEVTPRSTYDSEHLADTVKVTARQEKFAGRVGKVYRVHYGKWQIAHLLEFGWTLRNGKRLERAPFVRPLFDKNKDKYYRMYKEGLSK